MSGWRSNIIVSSFESSVDTLKKGWSRVLVSVALDLTFLISFAFVLTFFQYQVNKLLIQIESFLSSGPNVSNALLSNSNVGSILQQQQTFSDLSSQLVKWTMIFFVVIYFVYTFLQSISWHSVYKINASDYKTSNSKSKSKWRVGNRLSYWSYLGQFAYVNLFWLLVSSLLVYVGVRVTIFNKLSLYPLIQDSTGVGLVVTTMIVAAYFMLISYAVIGTKSWKRLLIESLKLGFKKFYLFVLLDFVFFLSIVIIGYVLKWAMNINFMFMLILGILLLMPTFSWLRILHIEIVKRLEQEEKS